MTFRYSIHSLNGAFKIGFSSQQLAIAKMGELGHEKYYLVKNY